MCILFNFYSPISLHMIRILYTFCVTPINKIVFIFSYLITGLYILHLVVFSNSYCWAIEMFFVCFENANALFIKFFFNNLLLFTFIPLKKLPFFFLSLIVTIMIYFYFMFFFFLVFALILLLIIITAVNYITSFKAAKFKISFNISLYIFYLLHLLF